MTLAIAIVGAVTGIAATIIALLEHNRERPRLSTTWTTHYGGVREGTVEISIYNTGRQPAFVYSVGMMQIRSFWFRRPWLRPMLYLTRPKTHGWWRYWENGQFSIQFFPSADGYDFLVVKPTEVKVLEKKVWEGGEPEPGIPLWGWLEVVGQRIQITRDPVLWDSDLDWLQHEISLQHSATTSGTRRPASPPEPPS